MQALRHKQVRKNKNRFQLFVKLVSGDYDDKRTPVDTDKRWQLVKDG